MLITRVSYCRRARTNARCVCLFTIVHPGNITTIQFLSTVFELVIRISYLLNGENQPECQICHSPLTVKHILIDCTCFGAARQRYLGVDTHKELFENVESRNIVAFIKDTNFGHCIRGCFYISLIAVILRSSYLFFYHTN